METLITATSEVKHDNGCTEITFSDGVITWYKHNKLHREDGPASIYPDGTVFWYFDGLICTFNHWCVLAMVSPRLKFDLMMQYGD